MSELSTEARVLVRSFWHIMSGMELSFARPHIITSQARKGLDDLVDAGYLTVDASDNKTVWKPTEKMKTDKPKVTLAFVEEHNFPLTTE